MEVILTALSIGLASGIAPGPLTILAITATLRRGRWAGVQIAIAPLLSDAIIILISISVVSRLPYGVLDWLGLAGGIVIALFAIETLRSARAVDPNALVHAAETGTSRFAVPLWIQGFLVNLLNPAPWIFWITAGSALLVSTWRASPPSALGFLVAFYAMLVGSKVVLVLFIGATRHRITPRAYRGVLAVSGLLLLVVAAGFLFTAVTALWNSALGDETCVRRRLLHRRCTR